MGDESAADTTGTTWAVLHLFCRVTPGTDAGGVVAAVKAAGGGDHQVVTVSVLGQKADIGFMALGPDVRRLRRLQSELRGAGLELAGSYVSLTELSEYAAGLPEDMREARLHPRLPPAGKTAFCFYPMSKRRTGADNWYLLDFDERLRLMQGHGKVGREFRGRIVQLITGSTGLDDWEWGVTLFGRNPDDLKDCVYQMRFDEASARFADFGPFVVGTVRELEDVLEEVGLR